MILITDQFPLDVLKCVLMGLEECQVQRVVLKCVCQCAQYVMCTHCMSVGVYLLFCIFTCILVCVQKYVDTWTLRQLFSVVDRSPEWNRNSVLFHFRKSPTLWLGSGTLRHINHTCGCSVTRCTHIYLFCTPTRLGGKKTRWLLCDDE